MSIGVAIIGSGIFVQDEHLPAVAACENLTLKAIYSRSLKSAQSLKTPSTIDLYSEDSGPEKTYSALLSRSDIHAVIIALPIVSQPTYIEQALKAGKHVLSEKPIAKDVETARELIRFYREGGEVKGGATWGIAENFRFYESFAYAAGEVGKLGRVLEFRVKVSGNVKKGGKYFETPWRKVPEYQGGFLLDGGVHSVAGLRMLLGSDKPTSVSAYSTLLREHLPPVDTINSVWQTTSGVSGSFCMSFGTTLSGSEFTIACENGSVTIVGDKVTVRQGEQNEGKSTETNFAEKEPGAINGVKPELAAWAKSILDGKPDVRQSPEEALGDLEILELMLRSGEEGGQPKSLKYQV